jgi:hypothetical protein
LQWLQDPCEINGDNLNNVRHVASRYFRNKKWEYLKDKMNVLATNSKNKNIKNIYRGIKEYKRGYQSVSNLLKDGNGDLLADYRMILIGWKNYFFQLRTKFCWKKRGQLKRGRIHWMDIIIVSNMRNAKEWTVFNLVRTEPMNRCN